MHLSDFSSELLWSVLLVAFLCLRYFSFYFCPIVLFLLIYGLGASALRLANRFFKFKY